MPLKEKRFILFFAGHIQFIFYYKHITQYIFYKTADENIINVWQMILLSDVEREGIFFAIFIKY